jgi:putative methyltransferase (TIGR04325 family)
MSALRIILNSLMPSWFKRLVLPIRKNQLYFEEFSGNWAEALYECDGYDDPAILEKVATAVRQVLDGHAKFERDSVVFYKSETNWPVLGSLVSVLSNKQEPQIVLDFGGSLGSFFLQHRYFLEKVNSLRWIVVEQPHFVNTGKRLFPRGEIEFMTLEELFARKEKIDVILASSVFSYLEEPETILRTLADLKSNFLITDRNPVADIRSHLLTIQKSSATVMEQNYPSWIFSESQLNQTLETDWNILADWNCPEGTTLTRKKGIQVTWRGGMYERISV